MLTLHSGRAASRRPCTGSLRVGRVARPSSRELTVSRATVPARQRCNVSSLWDTEGESVTLARKLPPHTKERPVPPPLKSIRTTKEGRQAPHHTDTLPRPTPCASTKISMGTSGPPIDYGVVSFICSRREGRRRTSSACRRGRIRRRSSNFLSSSGTSSGYHRPGDRVSAGLDLHPSWLIRSPTASSSPRASRTRGCLPVASTPRHGTHRLFACEQQAKCRRRLS